MARSVQLRGHPPISKMKTFTIDPVYFTSVTIHKEWSMFDGRKDLTEDELIVILKGKDMCSSTECKDHPEFEKLRDELAYTGHIRITRNSWNGDTVLEPFILNGALFKRWDTFYSGAAMLNCVKFP